MKNRFQALKRVLSLIMVFAMVIGFVPNVASAAEQTKTVYFQNNWMWTDVCAYTFDSATNQYIGRCPQFSYRDRPIPSHIPPRWGCFPP